MTAAAWAERTWLVTGGSSGIGRAVAARVLAVGGRVAVTARDPARVDLDLRGRGIAVGLDLTVPETIPQALEAVTAALGPVDVLVNNAGYGLLGAVEETTDQERRAQMEANFFGPTWLNLMLPQFRERGSGAIVNISSVSGVIGPPGSAYYAASKHAIEGWSDSLRAEVGPFGVHVLVVEPGGFRTDFFGRTRHHTGVRSGIYDAVERRRATEEQHGAQAPGDPERGAAAILAALESERPPARLVLGAHAADLVHADLQRRLAELDAWRATSASADHPGLGSRWVWRGSTRRSRSW